MKKDVIKGFISGTIVSLFFFAIFFFIIYLIDAPIDPYYENLLYLFIYIGPAISGIITVFLMRSTTFISLGVKMITYLAASFLVFGFFIITGLEHDIHKAITGYSEIGLGDGLIFVIVFLSHFFSCVIAHIISLIITSSITIYNYYKSKKDLS